MRVTCWWSLVVAISAVWHQIINNNGRSFIPPAHAATYPIDWAQVQSVATSTTSRAASIPANTNLGTCICDLTWAACDVNCVCDTDCVQVEKALFSTSLPTGQYSDNNTVCFDPDFIKVNARGGVSTFFLDQALCVNKQSSSLTGSYFPLPPTTVTDSTFQAFRNAIPYSYQVTATSSTVNTAYNVGDRIGALRGISSSTPYSYNRLGLSVPSAGPGGICNANSYAQYLLPVNHTCSRSIPSLQTECGLASLSSLAANSYLYNLAVSQAPVDPAATLPSTVPIVFSEVWIRDDTTLNYTLVNVSSTAGTFPSLVWDAVTCSCSNVLLQLEYHLTHTIAGIITSASVKAVLGTVYAADSMCVTSAAYVSQSYAVSWNSTVITNPLIPHDKSGNPGYLVGYPLLVGTHVSIGQADYENAIAQEVDGLQLLPQSAVGECLPLTTLPGLTDSTGQLVSFGENMITTCTLTMNLAQLQAQCNAGILSSYLNITSIKDYWFGVFGDSDFRKMTADWKQFTTVPPTRTLIDTTATAWNDRSRTCLSIFNSVNIEMLYVPVGSKFNPQELILAGRITFGESTWSFRHDDATMTQPFPVSATVTWIPYYNTTYTSSSKPNLPSFPRDFFYVFYNQLNGGLRTTPNIMLSLISIVVICMSYVL